jgi:hypothetical protein
VYIRARAVLLAPAEWFYWIVSRRYKRNAWFDQFLRTAYEKGTVTGLVKDPQEYAQHLNFGERSGLACERAE